MTALPTSTPDWRFDLSHADWLTYQRKRRDLSAALSALPPRLRAALVAEVVTLTTGVVPPAEGPSAELLEQAIDACGSVVLGDFLIGEWSALANEQAT